LLGQTDPIQPEGVEQQAEGVGPGRVLERRQLLVTRVMPHLPGRLGYHPFSPLVGVPQVIVV
jgi:hypothetical protein